MTRINLLPEEYRKADRPSPVLLLALVATTLLVCGTLGALAYLQFSLLGTARAETEVAREQLATLKPFAQYALDLEQEHKEYQRRSETIADIAASRILWTRKLDRLANIIHADGDPELPLAWLTQIKVERNAARDKGITLKGSTASDQLKKLSDFHYSLWHDPAFFEGFVSITDPEGTLRTTDDVEPPEAFDFDFKLVLGETTGKK
ncbi:MAG: hypothetical protein AB1486_00295 [Planctomycetota bacterium]